MNTPQHSSPQGGSCLGKLAIAIGLIGIGFIMLITFFAVIGIMLEDKPYREITDNMVILDDTSYIHPSHEGRHCGISGRMTADGKIEDTDFGIKLSALQLERTVSVYRRTKRKTNSLSSEQAPPYEWSTVTEQKETDASSSPWMSKRLWPDAVRLGTFTVTPAIMQHEQWNTLPTHKLPSSTIKLPESIAEHGLIADGYLYLRSLPFSAAERARPYEPREGDRRITWEYIPNHQKVTMIARQQQGTLIPTSTAEQRNYLLLQSDVLDPQTLLDDEEKDSNYAALFLFISSLLGSWGLYALVLFGIRGGASQPILVEGWMSLYGRGSSFLLAIYTAVFLYSVVILALLKLSGIALLLLCIVFGWHSTKKALRRGHELRGDAERVES